MHHRMSTCWAWAMLLLLAGAMTPVAAQDSELDAELLSACNNEQVDEVRALLAQGANPNATRRGGRSVLSLATDNVAIMKLLIDAGADVDAVDRYGRSVLTEAATEHEPDGVELLLASGAKPDPQALGLACWLGRTATVEALLAAGVPADAGLPSAAQGGHVDLVRRLLEAGADVNPTTDGGTTALHLGALQGGPVVVAVLLDHSADPNAINDEGETPLHMAVSGDGNLAVIKALVTAGARLDLPNDEGITPVRLAGQRGGPVYAYLLEASGGEEPKPAAAAPRPDAPPTAVLLADLSSKDRDVRMAAQRQLVARGEAIMPELLPLLETREIDGALMELLMALGPVAEPAIPLLEGQLADEATAFGALLTIERIKPGGVLALADESKERAAESLYEVIVDPTSDVMGGFAAQMLMGLGDAAVPTILKLLRHDETGYRAEIARRVARSRFVHVEVTAELLKLARHDPDVSVRTEAAAALGVVAPDGDSARDEAREALLEILRAPPPHDWRTADESQREELGQWQTKVERAARSLSRFGPGIIEDVLPLLSPMENPGRIPSITAIQSIGAPAVPRLIELMAHEDDSVSISASVALNRIRGPAVPALTEALASDNAQVVVRAASALWWIRGAARPALSALLNVAGSEDKPDRVRLAAVRAALRIDPAQARAAPETLACLPTLIRMLESGAFIDQGQAAESLGAIGPAAREALPMLRERLALPDETVDTEGLVRDYVSREAAQAIKAIEGD
jgi:ankyrin repeat protein/HEAT repeat protein